MSATAGTYQRLYLAGRVSAPMLQRAVSKGLISQEEYALITEA